MPVMEIVGKIISYPYWHRFTFLLLLYKGSDDTTSYKFFQFIMILLIVLMSLKWGILTD